jgi:predicted amidophosphoribosyltransferase
MSCEFNQEGFCILQCLYPELSRCRFAKDDMQECVAKESDLIEICDDCNEPMDEYDCGTNLVIVQDSQGKYGLVTMKTYHKLLKEAKKELKS